MSSLSIEVTDFFPRLAERRYRENDLSDATWALCHAVPRFAAFLADFIGITMPPGVPVNVEREVSLGVDSRVDIRCSVASATTFIEVKIYDRNYHLQQYAGRIVDHPGSHLVLLTNHVLDPEQRIKTEQLGWSVRLWRDFVECADNTFGNDEILVRAYLRYVRRVCNMIELRDVRFDPSSLYSLVSLNVLIEEVMGGASHSDFTYSRYQTQRAHGSGWTGACFQLQYQHADVQRQVWGFFGLTFEEPGRTQLAIWLDRDWNVQFLDTACEIESLPPERTWLNADGLGIAAADEDLQHLLTLPLAEQRSLLQSLFAVLLKPIEHHLAKACSSCEGEVNTADRSEGHPLGEG